MVQPSRLKNKVHPIFPILLVITFVVVAGFVALPNVLERLSSDYDNYRSQRAGYVTQYNLLMENLNSVLEYKYVSKDQYLEGLNRSLNIINEIKGNLDKTSGMSIKALDARLSDNLVDEVENDLAVQSKQLSTITNIENQIKRKIEAINVINSIQDLTYCLKSVKDRYDLQECEYISENITSPAVISGSYKKNLTYLYSKYFEISKKERVSRINSVISEHNNMNSGLEKILNSPIVY